MIVYTIDFNSITQLNDDRFSQLCFANPDLKFERNAKGELIIMPPTGGKMGRRNAKLIVQLSIWNDRVNLGEVFDSSTCFRLPNDALRSPDAAWITREKWQSLSEEEKEKFPPLCPDFIIELRSKTDNLQQLQEKMQEYRKNGARLGWLINPQDKQVEIYRFGKDKEILDNPTSLSGEDVLVDFVLNLQVIW